MEISSQWIRFQKSADGFKTLGDGFMAVFEVKRRINPVSILNNSLECCRAINHLIDESLTPRPYGFRIRISEGDGLKFQEFRIDKSLCHQTGSPCPGFISHDYISYYINMTKELLSVDEHVPVIVHQNFKELLNGKIKRSGIKFRKLKRPDIKKTDIFKEDLEMLWIAEKKGAAYQPREFRR